jgi:cyclophilin family peptidyl-prolyl cis-trans isomerase
MLTTMNTLPTFAKTNRSTLRALGCAVAALPLLVACGGGGGGGDTPAPFPVATVSTAVVATPKYSQTLLLTLTGTNLDLPITVTSTGCAAPPVRSTTAPNISTATTAYYTCKSSAVGAQQFVVTRVADNVNLSTAAYTVPVPQVTMTVTNGAAVSGDFVLTLNPQATPVTVNNFLAYVNNNFYNNVIFHRYVAGFVLQAGGYEAGVTTTVRPTKKATTGNIVLEDNAGLSNTRLTVAMARTSVPDSANSEFFINLADNLFLNRTSDTARGYAVFGSVTAGAEVVTAMTTAPCQQASLISSECLPIPNLVITRAVQTR